MNSITQDIVFKQSVVEYSLKHGVTAAAKRYKQHRKTIYRWREKYDGTRKSLVNKSRRPHSNPKQHTEEEIKMIKKYRAHNKADGLVVLWIKLWKNGYTRSITRKEFCDLIYRLTATEFNPIADSRKGQQDAIKQVIAERQLEDKISEVSYSDCDDEKIKFLSGAGIIYGMDDGTFAPDDNITREQAAAILYRTAGFLGNKTIVEPNGTTFDDVKLISDWARESVSIMNSMKIMEGVSDTEFAPKGNYTVEQAIATMVRLYNCY